MSISSDHRQRRRIIIIYNADGSVSGKLRYAYKKLFQEKDYNDAEQNQPVCGNCDITHGGLSLTETAAWKKAKEHLQSSLNVEVAQLHRDELDAKMSSYVRDKKLRLPTVLLEDGESVKELVSRDQINVCVLGRQDQTTSPEEQKAELMVESIKNALQREQSDSKL